MVLITTTCFAFTFNSTDLGWNIVKGKLIDLIHNLSMLPESKAFGDVATNTTATQVFTLSNTGNYAAEEVAITVTGTGFTEQSRTCQVNPFTLASAADCTVTTAFTPTAAQSYSGFVNYSAVNIAKVSKALSGTGTGGTTYLVDQNFEGAGYDNSETWTETAGSGSIDEDSTSGPLRGSQSLVVASGATSLTETVITHTSAGEVWGHAIVKFGAAPTTTMPLITHTTSLFGIDFSTTGVTRVNCDSSFSGTTNVANSTKHVWWHYKKGTGANAVCEYWLGDTTSRPATAERSITNGALTLNATGLSLKARYSSSATYDQILVDDADIATVTP